MDNENFDEVVSFFSENIKNVLLCVSDTIKQNTYEIRLRVGKPIVLFGSYGSNFIKYDSTVSRIDSRYSVMINEEDLKKIIGRICGYSVYTHQHDISQGFVTFGNGHRAGFCGTAVLNNNTITALRDISSVNIRIARIFDAAADELLNKITNNQSFNGIIIAGAPCTGKTTILRSFANKVSSTYGFGFMKTVLIDERCEMSAGSGVNCDVLRSFSKTDGITHAIRVLSPEIVICDEVSTVEEAEKIIKGCYSGIKFVVSVHIGTADDLFLRPVSKTLADCGFFDYVVFLENSNNPGKIKNIVKLEELKNEFYSNSYSDSKRFSDSISYYT